MLANTITLTYSGGPLVFTRIREVGTTSVYRYRDANSTFLVSIKQTSYKDATRGVNVKRHAVDMVVTVNPVAPSIIPEVRKCYTVIENDEVHTVSSIQAVVNAVATFVQDGTNSTALIGEEY